MIHWLRSIRWINWLVAIAVVAIIVAVLVPSRQRTPRVYYQGASQFHWMNQVLWDEDPDKRREAAFALGEILRSTKIKCRCQIVSQLRLSRADGKPAIPALIELLEDEDQELREGARSAIEQIDPDTFSKLPAR
jgi:hypothetical protein